MATDEVLTCTPRFLPPHQQAQAVAVASANNPVNAPPHGVAAAVATVLDQDGAPTPTPEHLAVLVSRYWGSGGVRLTVGFLEQVPEDLAERIMAHANAWGQFCNVLFTRGNGADAQVRITLQEGGGYASYLGTDVLSIPPGQPTMWLEGFSMNTPESEYRRVVRHEFGHVCGFPHEHARRGIVQLLDRRKTTAYFRRTQGWSAQMIAQQILTPLEERSIMGTPGADQSSIMTYEFPGVCTKSGQPIPGGTDIDAIDQAFAARLYPLPGAALPPPPVMPEAV